MSFLRFVFTGVYSKEPGSSLPVRGDTPRPMPQELHQLCADLWYVSPSPRPCPPHQEPTQPSPTTQFRGMHPQVLRNRVLDAFTPPTRPRKWVIKALLPSLPCPALLSSQPLGTSTTTRRRPGRRSP